MDRELIIDVLEQIDSMVNPGVFLPLIKGLLEDVYIKGFEVGREQGYEDASCEHQETDDHSYSIGYAEGYEQAEHELDMKEEKAQPKTPESYRTYMKEFWGEII